MAYSLLSLKSTASICLVFLLPLLSLAVETSEFTTLDNSTSCEEFVNGTTLDITKLLDIDWKIFYFWTPGQDPSYNIRFSLPTKMLVDRYRVALYDIKPEVNWNQVELFMETSIGISALYIKTNVSGLFRVIPSTAFETKFTTALMFALKLIEPEQHLGMLHCKYRLCYALAPVDKMPQPNEIEGAAAQMRFWNNFGYSYFNLTDMLREEPLESERQMEDADDDEQHEIEMEEMKMSMSA